MQSFNWISFLLAFLGTTGLVLIGIGISLGSSPLIIGAIVLTLLSVGTGFGLKRKGQQEVV
ncbi:MULTISPECIES: DUF5325 family protein [Bacillaceae]|uniref:YlaF family protein n=1 Tax=Evansella alkalicola TaxID=745819 RepID=A0ABS6JS12_9BACI|nr:DUF5325 family protein [Litchfieldia alkalitelluris]MBU9720494.1 YlaF family protein [Bacillus alkalicola]